MRFKWTNRFRYASIGCTQQFPHPMESGSGPRGLSADAAQALRLGLVEQMVAVEQVQIAVEAFADKRIKRPAMALREPNQLFEKA